MALFYSLVFALICSLRFLHFMAAPHAGEPIDALVFQRMAALPWTDPGLWGGIKPPLAALSYKILQGNPQAIVFFQMAFSLFCWGFLALAVSRTIKTPWLKPPAYVLILLFGLSAEIIVWDFMILSESLSISLFALTTALALRMLNHWRPAGFLALILAGGAWALCRDTNAWLLLGMALATAAVGLIFCKHRRACVVLALCWCAFFAADMKSSKMSAQSWTFPPAAAHPAFELPPRMGQRWIFPFLNVLTQRILPDPAKVQWFADRGMPVTSDLTRLAGQWGAGDNFAVYRLGTLQPFRAWLVDRGQTAYIKYLLGDWRATIMAPWHSLDSLFSPETWEPLPPGFAPILPAWISPVVYPALAFPFWPWIAGAIALAGLVCAGRDRRRRWWIAFGLLLLAFPHALLVWHGDAMAIGRHALLMQMQIRLSLALILLFAADTLADALSPKRGPGLE